MLLIGGKGAGTAAGGGAAVVVAGIVSIFAGSGEEQNGGVEDDPQNGQEVVVENDEAENGGNDGGGESPFDPAGTDLNNNGTVINGNGGAEEVDPIFAPKHDVHDLLRAVRALSEVENPTYEKRSAVFGGDTTLVQLFDDDLWSIFIDQLLDLAERGRGLREGPNPTSFGPLQLMRTAEGEWRINLVDFTD